MESDAGLATSPKPYINSFTMYIVNHVLIHINYVPYNPLKTFLYEQPFFYLVHSLFLAVRSFFSLIETRK